MASSGSTSDFPEMSVIEERTEGREKRYFTIFFGGGGVSIRRWWEGVLNHWLIRFYHLWMVRSAYFFHLSGTLLPLFLSDELFLVPITRVSVSVNKLNLLFLFSHTLHPSFFPLPPLSNTHPPFVSTTFCIFLTHGSL